MMGNTALNCIYQFEIIWVLKKSDQCASKSVCMGALICDFLYDLILSL